jgi:outer membrane immunogenic protein
VTRLANCCMAVLVLALTVGVASAQSDKPWDGFYAGLGVGGASHSGCSSWTPTGVTGEAAAGATFYSQSCPGGSTMVGGVQVGENFQYEHLFWGIGADLDFWSAKSDNQLLTYTGNAPPPGTYSFFGKSSPSAFAIIAPRIGYAGRQWLPYVTGGALLTIGSSDSMVNYIPAGSTKPTASFSGGKSYASSGWVAGGGVEYGLNGPWSIKAEYLHMELGKGSNATASCSGTAAACAAFSAISLDNLHSGFSANMFRIGFNYWFNYWEP